MTLALFVCCRVVWMAARRGSAIEPAARLTWANVLAWRLRRQRLTVRAPRGALLPTVAAISGLQAQVISAAELAAWARR